MLDLLNITPEHRFEATRVQREDLAAVAAAAENPAVALTAQWGSDLTALQEHLWGTVLVASPDLNEEFAKVNHFILTGLTNLSAVQAGADAHELIVTARNVVADQFSDPFLLADWTRGCADIGHLHGVPVPANEHWSAIRDEHLHTVPAEMVLQRRRDEILALADDLLNDRPRPGARSGHERVWVLDWTVFHAHLLEVAIRCGDTSLMSVDLRWRVAAHKIGSLTALPVAAHEAAAKWRAIFAAVVGPLEAAELEKQFLTV